ncbi:uncharacterized protein [Clytia hemisphaerica]|uniref:Uncharacterized protein n=1 Tax=Clytia hemisphaerica TaxID=252671 RepID=A0A7M5UUD0_9CNID
MISLNKRMIAFIAFCLLIVVYFLRGKDGNGTGSIVDRIVFMDKNKDGEKHSKTIRNKPKIVSGDIQCKNLKINPFADEMMNLMKDFGKHECDPPNELTTERKGSTLSVTAYKLNFISTTEVIKEGKSFKLGDKKTMTKPKSNPVIQAGNFGSLRNSGSKLCVVPTKEQESSDYSTITFTSECNSKQGVFEFTKEGFIKEKADTKRCFGLKPNTQLKNDAIVVLTKDCGMKFEIVHGGVLKTTDFCIHPLGGGGSSEGQKLCFYKECSEQKRLQYHFYNAVEDKKETQEFEITKEFNMVEYTTTDGKTYNDFVASVPHKEISGLKAASGTQPNVFIITLGEVSSSHFQRKLPKSWKYLQDEMKSTNFPFYAPTHENFIQNVDNLIKGTSPTESADAKTLISLAREKNYLTLFSSDSVHENLTTIEADHSALSLFQAIAKNYDIRAKHYCIASKGFYELSFNYLNDFISTYKKDAKFGMIVLNEMTSQNYNLIGYMDEKLKDILHKIHQLPNTVLIVNSIKGTLLGKLAQTIQGQQEHKQPFLNIYSSNDLKDRFSLNVKRTSQIVSPYDLHFTVKHILTGDSTKHKYGLSLFGDKDFETRKCQIVGVPFELCPCKI